MHGPHSADVMGLPSINIRLHYYIVFTSTPANSAAVPCTLLFKTANIEAEEGTAGGVVVEELDIFDKDRESILGEEGTHPGTETGIGTAVRES